MANTSFTSGIKPAVLIGVVPLTAVSSFVLNEGFKISQVAGSSTIAQMLSPINKTLTIEAHLIGDERALRPALEALAMSNRVLAAAAAPLMKFTGIPVVARLGVHLDMQITTLVFTQDNVNRDTLKVSITLVNVPRTKLGGILGGALDLAAGVGSAFI
jgi:hypothetical protein